MICPLCKNETVEVYRPFCSKICKDEDLIHWANGTYRIPIENDTLDEEDLKNV